MLVAWRIFIAILITLWCVFWGAKLIEAIVTKNNIFFDYEFVEKMELILKIFAPLCVLLSLTFEEHLMIASIIAMAVIFIPYFAWFIAIVFYAVAIEPVIISIKKSIEAVKTARSK